MKPITDRQIACVRPHLIKNEQIRKDMVEAENLGLRDNTATPGAQFQGSP